MQGMAVFSDGTKAEYPMYYRKAEKKLAGEQRKLSRCKKGSHNYQKQKVRLAKAHEKIRNQRKDFHHKLSHELTEKNDVIVVENLNMRGMSQALRFGKSTRAILMEIIFWANKYELYNRHRNQSSHLFG